MAELVALCDGHGLAPVTPGKRTFKFDDGSVMYENEFNRAVVKLLDVHLRRCGFRTLLVAPTDADTPLSTRVALANKAKADLYLSVHANAHGSDWNGVRGIETYHYPNSTKSKRPAEILHRHLITGTALPNRGVKQADFQVLRETTMAAVLVECAFMTNMEDAKLLLSESYRAECAEELARGICELYGRAYVKEPTPEVQPETPKAPVEIASPDTSSDVTVVLNGKRIAHGKLEKGVTYAPVRSLAEALGLDVKWDQDTKTVSLSNKQ